METLKPNMARTVFENLKNILFKNRASSIKRWELTQLLVQEGLDQWEVEESLDLLQFDASLIFEPQMGTIALVRTQ